MGNLFAKIAQTAHEQNFRTQARPKNPFGHGRNGGSKTLIASGQTATYDLGTRGFVENIVEWTEKEANTKLFDLAIRGSHDLSSRQQALEDPTHFFLTEKYE